MMLTIKHERTMTDTSLPPKRRHPLFPTVAEAKSNPELVYSDHLSITTTVPLGPDKTPLKVASLNILGENAGSGFNQGNNWETKENTSNRYHKMIQGLAQSAQEENGVDVIFLQETGSPELTKQLKEQLQTKLGDDWEIVLPGFERAGIISCYNKKRFDLCKDAEGNPSTDISYKYNHANGIHTLKLEDKNNNMSLDLHNVWGRFNPFPDKTEACYKKLLTDTSASVSVIFGDTNSRIAPIDSKRRNIATGIAPLDTNEKSGISPTVQVTDYPDGGFYRDKDGIHQLSIEIRDYKTGKIVTDERSPETLDAWPEFRMVLCLDEYYKKTPLIGNQTIFNYEAELRKVFNDSSILVRASADNTNQKAIGIRFSRKSALYDLLKKDLKDEPCLQFRNVFLKDSGGDYQPCVFVPMEKVNLLHQAIAKKTETHGLIISKINSQLKALTTFNFFRLFLVSSPDKVAALKKLQQTIEETSFISSNDVLIEIITQWEKQNQKIIDTHRNIFAPNSKTPTATRLMLNNLKKELDEKNNNVNQSMKSNRH